MSIGRSAISELPVSNHILEFTALAAAGHDIEAICDGAVRSIAVELDVDCCHVLQASSTEDGLKFVAGQGGEEGWAKHAVRAIALRALSRYAPAADASAMGR